MLGLPIKDGWHTIPSRYRTWSNGIKYCFWAEFENGVPVSATGNNGEIPDGKGSLKNLKTIEKVLKINIYDLFVDRLLLKGKIKLCCKFNNVSTGTEVYSYVFDYEPTIFEEAQAESKEVEKALEKIISTLKYKLREWPVCNYGGDIFIDPVVNRKSKTVAGKWKCSCKEFEIV